MSRGIGAVQCRIVTVLGDVPEEELENGLPVAEVRYRVGSVDKSNFRRSLRSLLVRQRVELLCEDEGVVRLRLCFLGRAAVLLKRADYRRPHDERITHDKRRSRSTPA
jgi:hypothetical protein